LVLFWFFFFFLGNGTMGATVYLLCRNKERGEKAVEKIRTKN
jgi:hypothetical protein